MPESLTRRGFLVKTSMATAAGVAATVAASSGIVSAHSLLAGAPAAHVAPAAAVEESVAAIGADIVAHVRNASKGEVSVMVGEHEVVLTDRALVARLLKGARQAGREA
jgi:hypothetical protein